MEVVNFNQCYKIHRLPENIGEWAALRSLDLGNAGNHKLPASLAMCPSLKKLVVGNVIAHRRGQEPKVSAEEVETIEKLLDGGCNVVSADHLCGDQLRKRD